MRHDEDFNAVRPDPIVITSVETLKTAFQQWAEEAIQKYAPTRARREDEAMIDADSVMARLGVARTTLWRWNNVGYLVRHKVRGRNCYRLADVERIERGEARRPPVRRTD